MPTKEEIEAETDRIAKQYGCDRAVFTVCWGEHERGETCRCRAAAIAALRKSTQK